MNLLIVVIIVLFLVGSVTWAMPSPRMRELSTLRQTAISQGLSVKRLKHEELKTMFSDIEDDRSYMGYSIKVRKPDNTHWNASREKTWDGCELRPEQLEVVSSIEGVSHIISHPGEIILVWNERGGKTEVEKMIKLSREFL